MRCCHTSSSRRLGGGSCRPWPMRMEVARAAVGSKPWLLILGTELSSLCRETPPGRRKLRPELHAPSSKLRGLKVLPRAGGSLEPNTPKSRGFSGRSNRETQRWDRRSSGTKSTRTNTTSTPAGADPNLSLSPRPSCKSIAIANGPCKENGFCGSNL